MQKAINNWIKSGEYDFQTAQAMFQSKRYIYVVFMCHLSLEKFLKAVVLQNTKKAPSKTHDLASLVRSASLNIPSELSSIIARLNEVSIPTRYPEDFVKLQKSYTQNVARHYLGQVEVLLKWLKAQLN